jgi:tetraacyldisaccharide 4'-kinase
MRDPSFWWKKPTWASRLLTPIAAGYGAIAARRLRLVGRRVNIPVFCIGNFTLGGAGKTPTAIAVARMLIVAGERPFFLSRGYGGRLAGPLRVDLNTHRADEIGDEPLLLARVAPTIVAHHRYFGATFAQADGASIVVMDDGLQNPLLFKDLTIAVIDGRRGIGNGAVFPAGPLRAPLAAQIDKADALLVVGAPSATAGIEQKFRGPVFRARLEPDPRALEALKGQRVLAYAGIGDPDKFFATLTAAGIPPRATHSFGDHHRYTPTESEALLAHADAEGLMLLTTEKDMARLAGDPDVAALAIRSQALPVSLVLEDEPAFRHLILERIGKA